MVAVLKTEGLSKRFGRIEAVRDLSLEVEEGDIYGFLGLNGAGKTTTLRMVLQLIRPTSGHVSIFGKDVRREFIAVMKQVGSLVEQPAAYPYLTARKNLEIMRLVTGGVERGRIVEVLEQVGLRERMDDRVRGYSQGMRQRLGIAMALLPKPRLVILDEPTNGLDPNGINYIRSVIRDLNRKGVTFVISSHLLHEVEITCNRVGIIKDGRLLLQDTVGRILERTVNGLYVSCEPVPEAATLLRAQEWVRSVEDDPRGGLRVVCDASRFREVNELLVGKGIGVSELSPLRGTLEDFFLSQ